MDTSPVPAHRDDRISQELARIEALPLAERPDALEALERRLRASLDDDD